MYLITFHSNFDANMFNKKMSSYGKLTRKPVPRELSSSCGTCFLLNPNDTFSLYIFKDVNFEAVYEIKDEKYIKIKEKE